MKKRLFVTLLVAVLMVLPLTACGGGSEDVDSSNDATVDSTEKPTEKEADVETEPAELDLNGVDITFWHSMGGINGEATTYLVDKFNSENEFGITVEEQYQGSYDDAINKLKSAQIGNMGADLVQIYDIGTRFMIDSGWVITMQELMERDNWDISQVEPNIAAYYTIDDTLYSMPFNSSTPILYYNKDIFEAAGITDIPTSFPEIEEIGEKLMADGGAKHVMSMGVYGWFFEQFTGVQGEHYVDNGNGREAAATSVAFDSNGAGLAILEAWKSLYDKGYAPNVGRGGSPGRTSFVVGEAAMCLESTAALKQMLVDTGDTFEIGTAYFPKITNDDNGGVSIGGGALWALNNEDELREAATWEFVKFLVSPESQAYWNAQTGYFPITVASHDEPVFKANIEEFPQFMTAIDQLHDTSPQSAGALLSVFPEARATVEEEIENMLNGKSPEDALAAMASSINSAIEDYNLLND